MRWSRILTLNSDKMGATRNGVLEGTSMEFSRENIYGGWATLFVLLLLFLFWQCKRLFFTSRSRSSSILASDFNNTSFPSDSDNSQLGISEIVSDADLKFLMQNLDEILDENNKWENVIDRRNNLLSYNAKCCKPKDGPLKYLSVTVFENTSSEMLRDFYMDNDYRKQWDKTLVEHEQLQLDMANGVEIGHTIKKFPLLTPREYVLAWKLWEGRDKTFYCFIKECEHPLAPRHKKYVRVEFFRSGWRIRKVPGRSACEITMFHQEDAGLNVEMAKLAFAKGIWSYVGKMDNALRKYSVIRNQTSAVTAVSLRRKVPPSLDMVNGISSPPLSSETSLLAQVSGETDQRLFLGRPSRKLLANSLLVLGGVICLSRGHSSLGAKVAMAYILTKLSKRGAQSNKSKES
ncbi:Polyketide cyclase/dehydrase and lipid transport superfamily protein [Quillaja saponaria]|uniref:Polyketide cyclase/dehydrase and lipid transport superfamily protein n=1 Tax=Quillaja saponaria TaxID=32244 RepID=A0AAD7L668_QUISA|nr:Polyketide cyclase/dehydrase and lipid transport superfamily protein [Quillaja saponaria]